MNCSSIVIVIIIRAQLTNNLKFSPLMKDFSHEKDFPSACCRRVVYPARHRLMKRFLVIVLHSFHFRFLYCRSFLFFYFSLWARTQPAQKTTRRVVVKCHVVPLDFNFSFALSFFAGVYTLSSRRTLKPRSGWNEWEFLLARSSEMTMEMMMKKKNAEICCSSGVLFE